MQTVERRILLMNGPPWGFRLTEIYSEGLIISQIRRQSPAEMAGLRENDRLLAIENISTLGMGRMYAVNLINDANGELEVVVQRQERRKQQMMTFYLDTGAARGMPLQQELTTREMTLLWEKEPTPPPPAPRSPSPVLVQPFDPHVTPMSLDKLLREFEAPKIAHHKRQTFSNSSFYTNVNIQYPSLEEQMSLANAVAESITSPANYDSKGFNMFESQRVRSENFVKEGPEPVPDPIINATKEQLQNMPPLSPPPPPAPKAASFPSMQPSLGSIPPPPPPPPPGQPRSLQEFLEKVKLFPKSEHNQISPQVCFDLASALHTSSEMFAKRRARMQAAEEENQGVMGRAPPTLQPVVQARPKLVSKLVPHEAPAAQSQMQSKTSLKATYTALLQVPAEVEKPQVWNPGTVSPIQSHPVLTPKVEPPSQLPKWRPVKFNIPQAAT